MKLKSKHGTHLWNICLGFDHSHVRSGVKFYSCDIMLVLIKFEHCWNSSDFWIGNAQLVVADLQYCSKSHYWQPNLQPDFPSLPIVLSTLLPKLNLFLFKMPALVSVTSPESRYIHKLHTHISSFKSVSINRSHTYRYI